MLLASLLIRKRLFRYFTNVLPLLARVQYIPVLPLRSERDIDFPNEDWPHLPGSGGASAAYHFRKVMASCKISVAWHVRAKQPCPDYLCPEGRQASVFVRHLAAPFVALLLRLCNDVETNPGPPPNPNSPVKRRSNSRRDSNRQPRWAKCVILMHSTTMYSLKGYCKITFDVVVKQFR